MESSFLTHQEILKLPFTHKVWLLVHLSYYDFIRWNDDGTVMLLDLAGLEIYLNSPCSIFNIETHSTFLEYLELSHFERLETPPQAGQEILLQYRNKYFQRYRLDVVPYIPECEALKSIVLYQNESRILEELFKISNEKTNQNSHLNSLVNDNIQQTDLSLDLFENQYSPSLYLTDDEYQMNLSGYYNNYDIGEVMHVVGDYLPKYNGNLLENGEMNSDAMNENTNMSNESDQSLAPMENCDINLNLPSTFTSISQLDVREQENLNAVVQEVLNIQDENTVLFEYDTIDQFLQEPNSLFNTAVNTDIDIDTNTCVSTDVNTNTVTNTNSILNAVTNANNIINTVTNTDSISNTVTNTNSILNTVTNTNNVFNTVTNTDSISNTITNTNSISNSVTNIINNTTTSAIANTNTTTDTNVNINMNTNSNTDINTTNTTNTITNTTTAINTNTTTTNTNTNISININININTTTTTKTNTHSDANANNSETNNSNTNESNVNENMMQCEYTNVNFLASLGLMLKPKPEERNGNCNGMKQDATVTKYEISTDERFESSLSLTAENATTTVATAVALAVETTIQITDNADATDTDSDNTQSFKNSDNNGMPHNHEM